MLYILAGLLVLNQVASGLPIDGDGSKSKALQTSVDIRYYRDAWVTDIQVGQQTFTVLLDTGSIDLILMSNTCAEYNSQVVCLPFVFHPPVGTCPKGGYNMSDKTGTCTHNTGMACYGDGAYAQYTIYSNTFGMGEIVVKDQYFGAITSMLKNMFSPELQGYLGLGYDSNSNIYFLSQPNGSMFINTMVSQLGMANEFALCFNDDLKTGKMILGAGYLEGMKYIDIIPIFKTNGKNIYRAYNVAVTVFLGNVQIGDTECDGISGLVDSGTTVLVLPKEWLANFFKALCPYLADLNLPCLPSSSPLAGLGSPYEVDTTQEQINKLPDMIFDFGDGVVASIPPQFYYYPQYKTATSITGFTLQ
eukprot:Ihof_evm2s592 gene=Ihof_evmTU2s592